MFKEYVEKKKFFVFVGLGVFGALALAFIFWSNWKTESPQLQFSVALNKTKISRSCKKWIDQLVADDEPDEYTCTVRTKKSYEGAGYTVKSHLTIKRDEQGGKIKVELQGSLKNPTRHATEAEFCVEECDIDSKEMNTGANTMDIIGAIAEMTNSLENQVKEAVREAKVRYDEKKQEENMAKRKEKACLGKWNQTDRYFEEFSIEQQIDCKFTRLRAEKDPKKREWYYQHVLKKDLWKLAVEGEDIDFLRGNLLSASTDSYYSGSTKSSVDLLSLYLDWKRDYAFLDTVAERERFGDRISREARNLVSRLNPNYARSTADSKGDIELLNDGLRENFAEAFARIRAISLPSTTTRGSSSTADYKKASEDVKDLW